MKRVFLLLLLALAATAARARDNLQLYVEDGEIVGYGVTDPATGQTRDYDADNNLTGSAVRANGYVYHYDLSGRLLRVTRP